MVTNLSSFPSALTVIPVPDGDIKKHRDDFVVNEDLKRLGCSGRSGMSLAMPAPATQAKFFQLYKTSDRIPLYGAVLELVKLCQVALMIFGKLDQEYCDGTLCDITERAITTWWTDIGSDYYNIEPTDGILGPTTVAALLGLLMGARNRLNYYGAPVAKDAFDVYALKKGISYFQKAQKMERTRRLDRQTLFALHNVTAKAAAGEGWGVPKAIKSTVTELGGKGGEMVMGMVGRDKAGIGDIETLDIDQFVSLIHGERAKWLWYGKAKRSGRDERDEPNVLSFTKDDQGGYIWSHTRTDSVPPDDEDRRKEPQNIVYANRPPGSATSMLESPGERDPQLRKTVFKSVTGKMSDARSGFGRIKDAVGLRGHSSRPSKDEGMETGYFTPQTSVTGLNNGTPSSPARVGKAFTWKDTPGQYQNGIPKVKETQSMPIAFPEEPQSRENLRSDVPIIVTDKEAEEADKKWTAQVKEIRRDVVANDPSIEGSAYGDLEGPLLEATREPNNFQILLHRRHSIHRPYPSRKTLRNEEWWPRRMSFSSAEDAVFSWIPIGADLDAGAEGDDWAKLQKQKFIATDLRHLYSKISFLQDDLAPWVEAKILAVDKQDEAAIRDQEEFRDIYYQLSSQYQAVKENSEDTINEERNHLSEQVAMIEGLVSKLEYEINTVEGKVRDMEDGMVGFETQVEVLEAKARELEEQLGTEGWAHWLVRTVTGIGTGPNIVRPRS